MRIWGWLAVTAFIGFLLLGFLPVGNDCGSAFTEGDGANVFSGTPELCEAARAEALRLPLLLLVVAVTSLVMVMSSSGEGTVRDGSAPSAP